MDFSILEKRLGVKFQDRSFLKQALTHRSFINEHQYPWPLSHFERLEFLGDAVLEMVVTDYLFRRYLSEPEGVLTRYRAAIVNTESLKIVARDLGLNEFLLLSRGEAKDTGRAREIILANAVEAVVGALYLDQGYDAAQQFITSILLVKTDALVKQDAIRDSKSRLQEKAQGEMRVAPTYALIAKSGPDHDPTFVIGVYFGSVLIAEGQGSSKQQAETNAAMAALTLKGWTVE